MLLPGKTGRAIRANAGTAKAERADIWDWEPVKLIEWHREKAGTIERVHDVLKNELATGVLPSKYFGANAAWLRLAVILLQRADGPEAFGVTRRFIAGPPEAAAISDLLHGRSAGTSRPTDALAAGPGDGGDRPVVGSPAIPSASDLTRTSVCELIDGFAEPLLEGSSENCCPMVYRSALHADPFWP